jgi:FkbM family methyltransferase
MLSEFKKILKKILKKLKVRSKSEAQNILQAERCKPWFEANGDTTLRLNYDLSENSIVFDLGGYKGEFAEEITKKYDCTIYVFEPIQEFYQIIKSKFQNNPKIQVFPFGLSSKNEKLKIGLIDNSSSVYLDSQNSEEIELKSIVEFIENQGVTKVDLVKINIEGGEYEVLESIIQNNKIAIFKNIQVQFHDFIIPNAKQRMNTIQKELAKSHSLTYQFEFVWENWKRNDNN